MTNLTTFAPKKSAVKNLVIFNRTSESNNKKTPKNMLIC